ncbi:MAG: hypothetical protein ACYTEQ_29725 [Planctomycetota bacterium]|jgi:hypothetical protein
MDSKHDVPIEDAPGQKLPFAWGDVWYDVEVAVLGLLVVCLSFLGGDSTMVVFFVLLGGMLLIEFVLPGDSTRRKESSMGAKKESLGLWEGVVIGILLIAYTLWVLKLQPTRDYSGAGLIFIGGCILALKALSRHNLLGLAYAIPTMLCGLLVALLDVNCWLLGGAAIAAGGATRASIQAHRLKRHSGTDSTDRF